MTSPSITSEIKKLSITSNINRVSVETNFEARQGPPGPPGNFFSITGEIPIGAINGINTNYALAHTPMNGVRVYVNGMRQKESEDYTFSSNIITFITPLIPGDLLLVDYNY